MTNEITSWTTKVIYTPTDQTRGNPHTRGIPSKRKPNTRRPLFRQVRGCWIKGKFHTLADMERMAGEIMKRMVDDEIKKVFYNAMRDPQTNHNPKFNPYIYVTGA